MPHARTDELPPDQRRREVAGILAVGLLRYLRRVRLASPRAVEESTQNRMALPTRATLAGGSTWVTARRPRVRRLLRAAPVCEGPTPTM